MKKQILLAVFSLCLALLSACGKAEDTAGNSAADEGANTRKEEENSSEAISWKGVEPGIEDLSTITDRTEYYDLALTAENLFDLDLYRQNPTDRDAKQTIAAGGTYYLALATQFYNGEPVQLVAKMEENISDIYLYQKDGSSQLLVQNAPQDYMLSPAPRYQWYLSQEGFLYCYRTTFPYVEKLEQESYEIFIAKISSSGEILYESRLTIDASLNKICQMEDGCIYLLLQNTDYTKYLAQLDPDTGEIVPDSQIDLPYSFEVFFGCAGDCPAVTGYGQNDAGYKIMKINPQDQSLSPMLYLTGTSYGWHSLMELQGLNVLQDGSVELLWTDENGLNCLYEKLWMEKVTKIPIVVRGIFYNNTWLADRAALFNSQNDSYHVVIEDCGAGNDAEDFYRLTSIQIASGKGPDILCGNIYLEVYIDGMLEKGALEALNPYMEASGVKEEDYFAPTFSTWRQGETIYGIKYMLNVTAYQISEEVLGSRKTPDIETLVDALLACEGDYVYEKGYASSQVLYSWLAGTDSLWGMVDWEAGSCDFNTPLFEKMLKAAARFGDDGRKASASSIRRLLRLQNFLNFKGSAEQEAEGLVTGGLLFDDGCYAASFSEGTLAVNASSAHKDGAWEFIRYLISEESQSKEFDFTVTPVNKKAFEKWMQAEIEKYTQIRYVNGVQQIPFRYGEDTSEKKKEEYRTALNEARPLPRRIQPILDILLDEAESYFNGSKNAQEVADVVNNRVRLYLNEIR